MNERKLGKGEKPSENGTTVVALPRSHQIASRGIRTSEDASNLVSALITDTMNEDVTLGKARFAVNAVGKLVAIKSAEAKYGQEGKLVLASAPINNGGGKENRRRALLEQLAAIDAE